MAVADFPDQDPSGAAPRSAPAKRLSISTARRRLAADHTARWLVTAGGLAIIAGILGILFFILAEVLPMIRSARVAVERTLAVDRPVRAVLVDEYQTHAAVLGPGGTVRVLRLDDGATVVEESLTAELAELDAAAAAVPAAAAPAFELLDARVPPGGSAVAASTSDGRVLTQVIEWRVRFDEEQRRIVSPHLRTPAVLALDPERRPLGAFAAQATADGQTSAAAQLADGTVVVAKVAVTENAFTGEIERSESRLSFPAVPTLTRLLIDADQTALFGGSESGELFWWLFDRGDNAEPESVSAGTAAVTALTLLVGDRSLVVGQSDGSLSVWFPVRQPVASADEDERFLLTRIRDFPRHGAPIVDLAPSQRNRTFLATDADGELGLYFSTSERVLWRGASPVAGATTAIISPKSDGAFLGTANELAILAIDNPHPEISWRALFGRIWFEGYERPEHAWQSTGGTDDFEAKLSLTPLVVGTLKGTLYSLLLAIPLGVLGAMFASQFLHPKLLGLIKPTVEIMASLPSVVLGFLAGLWLAPLLERTFPALLLAFVALPLSVWLAGIGWSRLPLGFRQRYPAGAEVGLYLVVVAAAIALCGLLSAPFERLAFGGSFPAWLVQSTGLPYDQRNAVVVGLAMGFAVIPIIFAISEDAFSNVPKSLIAGSLALGANRWQTVTRVVLPTASPGIFSAVMIGFGRAIGETMIVLMATGNTPIMQLNAFNGFRTLSANIAVEIPEAPHGGTLYRTLFLAALLLFVLTFVVNTVAELVRQRLRRKYAQL